ncbi:MAG: Crp/Fnr family transcriptional regulator [Candidatus Falkowbacteria bacterium]|nr:Crp/Fnr family transcriptional regulator [Candidatus Falkowbacteria bacterium]
MQYNEIKNAFNSVAEIDAQVWNEFEQYFTTRRLQKNEVLWNSGEVCKHLIFIKKGLIRIFDSNSDKLNTLQFFFENKILTDYYSFTSQNPCIESYEAIEETELIMIPRIVIYNFYDKYKTFERIGRITAEQNFISLAEIQVQNKKLSPEEKYSKLVTERPKVIQRVSLKYIASYLGMTPEHLSRIRNKYSKIANK